MRANLSTLLLCLVALQSGTGCGAYIEDYWADAAPDGSRTVTTFDDRFPTDIETVLDTCKDDTFDIAAGDTSIDLVGDCTIADLAPASQVIWSALGLADTSIDAIPVRVAEEDLTISGLPWPNQNCEIDLEMIVRFDHIELFDPFVNWTTQRNKPAWHLDLDTDDPDGLTFEIDDDADCPSWLSEATLQAGLDVTLPDGRRTVTLEGLDVDVYVRFLDGQDDPTQIKAKTEVVVDIDRVDVDTFITNLLGNNIEDDILSLAGLKPNDIESLIEDMVEEPLSGLGDALADFLEEGIPAGHVICDIDEQSGSLLITSAPTSPGCSAIGSTPVTQAHQDMDVNMRLP